jgi:uncharacterized protein (DUF433 family)
MEHRKEAPNMENVLASLEYVADACNEKDYNQKPNFADIVILYLKIKTLVKTDKSKEILKKYIINKNGRSYIKGTRLTADDIVRVWDFNQGAGTKEIMKEYPSLNDKEQVIAALIAYAKKNCKLRKLLLALL